jgi:hypothetical protein
VGKSGFEGIYRSGESPKRRAEALERLRAGTPEHRVAKDLGIAPHAMREIAAGLRADGELPAGDQPA